MPDELKSVTNEQQKPRSSSRSIKRKKFDDELVESSLASTNRSRPVSAASTSFSQPLQSHNVHQLSQSSTPGHSSTPTINRHVLADSFSLSQAKKRVKSSPKRIKKLKPIQSHATKKLGRWKPTDDLSLILSIQQTNDLETVYRGVKFSCNFTLQEIEDRWYSLLYDPTISKASCNAIKQLHPDVVAQIQAKVLFSDEEEKLIASVPSGGGNLETFQKLLETNKSTFLPSPPRTEKALFAHWALMKQYNLLTDQTALRLYATKSGLNFSEVEELIKEDLKNTEDESSVDKEELEASDRLVKREIRQLENELPKLQVLVDSITGVTAPEFDNKTYGILKGRIVRYLMQAREITIGRSAKDYQVDIDLSLEGPAWKISRRQAIITIDDKGDFYLINEGKKAFFVNGNPILSGTKCKFSNNAILEIVGLRFIFLVNQEMISALRAKNM